MTNLPTTILDSGIEVGDPITAPLSRQRPRAHWVFPDSNSLASALTATKSAIHTIHTVSRLMVVNRRFFCDGCDRCDTTKMPVKTAFFGMSLMQKGFGKNGV
jgi:hypothetical protein